MCWISGFISTEQPELVIIGTMERLTKKFLVSCLVWPKMMMIKLQFCKGSLVSLAKAIKTATSGQTKRILATKTNLVSACTLRMPSCMLRCSSVLLPLTAALIVDHFQKLLFLLASQTSSSEPVFLISLLVSKEPPRIWMHTHTERISDSFQSVTVKN